KAQEITLVESVAINLFVGALPGLGEQIMERHQSDAGAAIVRGVFSQSEPAVQFQIVHRGKAAVLVGDATGASFKLLRILWGPPIAEIPLGIELAPFIIEAVGQFMANHQADGAKIDCIVHTAVEKGWLQDAGGEDDLIMLWVVESIYGGRRDVPLGFVYRFSDLHELPMDLKLVGPCKVAGKVIAYDVELAVVAP